MPDGQDHQQELLFTWTYDDGSGRNVLPADEGSLSLEGIAHAAMIATHWVAEGGVRHRAPFSNKFHIYIAQPRPGSWITDFLIDITKPESWADAVTGAALVSGLTLPKYAFKLLRRISNRATGVNAKDDETVGFEHAHPGNFDALVDAATPAIKRAHKAIRNSKTTVRMNCGPFKLEFDKETREYIETNALDDQTREAVGNTAALSVNQRTGRFFIDEEGRTIPFLLHKSALPRTAVALARSLEAYASNRLANSDIVITYRGIRAQDGRLKNLIIFDATFGFGLRR